MRFLAYILIAIVLSVGKASARDITIAMGNIEPYFIPKQDSGIFTDLVLATFRHMPGLKPKFRFGLTNKVRWNLYEVGKVDAVANIFDSVTADGCRTDELFRFSDVAITRKESKLKLESVQDLAGKDIISFEGARGFFGESYSKHLSADRYFETKVQASQARMLITKRVDVSVGDLFIFLNALQDPLNVGVSPADFDYHPLFPQISTRMAFKDTSLCQPFNEALAKLRASGEYEKIYDMYLKRYNYK
ncbi:transporter substrate-binding domain-containing protein [Terasakiella sp. SH-1]|uniref:substrate-binding periplasmic protein n=1 Tax=Terasakiella sp. SH-1 TaxID=2560057 RepID=UPI0010749E9E|nr:transporter substrate-binding domain-containing protein [Terasakiella sp. SH-1]